MMNQFPLDIISFYRSVACVFVERGSGEENGRPRGRGGEKTGRRKGDESGGRNICEKAERRKKIGKRSEKC